MAVDPNAPTKPEKQGKPEPTKVSAATVRDRYTKGLRASMYERREYWLNYAFLRGRQWVYWNRQTNRIDDVGRSRGRYQATIDRLSSSSRTIAAKYLQRPLTFENRPSAADQDTIQKAKTGQAAIRQVQDCHDWQLLDEDLFWATWTGGVGAICVDWDADAGESVGYDEEGELFTGETVETILTIPEFVVEPGSPRAEKARWWIKGVVLPPETVQAMYGLEETPPNDAQSTMSPYNSRAITADSDALDQQDGTLVLTYYERPNLLNKTGTVAVVVDEKIVDTKEWPFPFKDRLNLMVMRETPVNGKWQGETVLSKATKVQVAINSAWSNYLEHLKSVGQARLMLPASQLDMMDSLEDDPRKPLKFIDGPGMALPQYLVPPQLPAWVINSIAELRNEMDDILGIHAISRGETPANIESGDGLRVLAEQDATPIGRMVGERARVWTGVSQLVLQIIAQNVKDTRTAIIQTSNEPPMTVPWTGKSIGNETNVSVPVDAVRPKSAAAQWMLAKDMMQMRPDWFKGPADFMAVAELPDAEDILWATDVQTAKARRVCHFLAEGVYMEPVIRDNHEVFIYEINNFMQTPRFEELDKDIQKLFELCVKGHQSFAEEQMGTQVAKGALSPALATTPNAAGAPTLPVSDLGGMPGMGASNMGPEASSGAGPPAPPEPPTPPMPPVGG